MCARHWASRPELRPATVFSAWSWVPPCRVWQSCVRRQEHPWLEHGRESLYRKRRSAPCDGLCSARRPAIVHCGRRRVLSTWLITPWLLLCVVACKGSPRLPGAHPAETWEASSECSLFAWCHVRGHQTHNVADASRCTQPWPVPFVRLPSEGLLQHEAIRCLCFDAHVGVVSISWKFDFLPELIVFSDRTGTRQLLDCLWHACVLIFSLQCYRATAPAHGDRHV